VHAHCRGEGVNIFKIHYKGFNLFLLPLQRSAQKNPSRNNLGSELGKRHSSRRTRRDRGCWLLYVLVQLPCLCSMSNCRACVGLAQSQLCKKLSKSVVSEAVRNHLAKQ
jgi:hypothetical protein